MDTSINTGTNWKNVNNWHWVDKNCLPWAKDYFSSKLQNLENTFDDTSIKITKVTVTGDCDLNQRKGQVIHIYDLAFTLEWSGSKENKDCTGKIEIPEVMHDTDIKDIVLDITLESPTREKNEIKEVCRIKFGPLLREQFTTFHVDLMDAHSKDVYISNDEIKGHPVTAAAYKPKPPVEALQTKTALDSSKGGLVTIEQEIEFQCNLKDLFDVLVDKQKVQLWTRAPAEISIEKDAKLVLFGGNITGNMIALVPNEKIEMSWRLKTWPEKHFSNVLITFQEKKDCTVLKLVQSKVPVGERDATEANWRNYYWNSIKRTFGYGSIL